MVNVLTNSSNISDMTEKNIFQLIFFQTDETIRKQFFGPLNMFPVEGCSERNFLDS